MDDARGVYDEFRRSVASFAQKNIAVNAAEVDRLGVFPTKNYDVLVSSGFHAPGVPAEYGGDGLDAVASAIMIEEIARACASTSTILTSNKLGVVPLVLAGSEAQKRTYLPQVAAGRSLMAYALSEREAGSDVSAVRCRAVLHDDYWELNGVKSWITSAGVADIMIVFARTDPEAGSRALSAFIVESSDQGVSFGDPEKKMGIRGSVTRDVLFNDCRIPLDRLLGDRGRGIHLALRTLDHTRVGVAAQAVGIAQAALDTCVEYLRQRQQFGQPLSSFQGLQFMVADLAIALESSRQMTIEAAVKSDAESADLTYVGAIAKCLASDVAMKIATDCVQLMGGAGYVQDFPAERLMRDAKITQIYEGTNQIQKIVIARHIFQGSRI